jgi:hypothetical protein
MAGSGTDGAPNYVKNAITGHTQRDEAENVRTYSSGPGLRLMDKYIRQIRYDIDFSRIKKSGWKRWLPN